MEKELPGDAFLEPRRSRTKSFSLGPDHNTARVLMVCPEFPYSFWSMPNGRKATGYKAILPPLGLLTVAALLPSRWEVSVADQNLGPIRESDWEAADLVMVSGMNAQSRGILQVISEARRRGKTLVAGGPYPSSSPEEVIQAGCDFVVCGEGETTVPLLIDLLREGSEGGVIRSRSRPDLSTSPIPRFDLIRMRDYMYMAIQTSRGCPFSCEFCNVVALFGNSIRYKGPGQVAAELELLHRLGAPRPVFICDDNFIGDRRPAKSILKAVTDWNRSHGEPFGFITQTSARLGADVEMIDLLTAANFGQVLVGVESPDDEALSRASKRQNLPGQFLNWMETICRNGLTVFPSFILGMDGEKKGVGKRICELVEKSAAPVPVLNLLHAAPGTRLWGRLEGEGRLLKEIPVEEEIFSPLNFLPDRPQEDVISEFKAAWEYLYEPSRFLARAYRYYLRMRPTRRAMARRKREKYDGPREMRPPMRQRLTELRAFLSMIWKQGVFAATRIQFWSQMLGMMRKNPSRLRQYMDACAFGEDMFQIRRMLINPSRRR
ncbi:MAG: B12-binding domain-containing radical SAM protein [Deltaproteobacteria bacterium HGW-Deltaproteobacteria-15]|nr:MAG: B12-binding domain-containing radical SAM protein [Deltaproteobacteria bacterium HGW-Deltaproteobacteria-15]